MGTVQSELMLYIHVSKTLDKAINFFPWMHASLVPRDSKELSFLSPKVFIGVLGIGFILMRAPLNPYWRRFVRTGFASPLHFQLKNYGNHNANAKTTTVSGGFNAYRIYQELFRCHKLPIIMHLVILVVLIRFWSSLSLPVF